MGFRGWMRFEPEEREGKREGGQFRDLASRRVQGRMNPNAFRMVKIPHSHDPELFQLLRGLLEGCSTPLSLSLSVGRERRKKEDSNEALNVLLATRPTRKQTQGRKNSPSQPELPLQRPATQGSTNPSRSLLSPLPVQRSSPPPSPTTLLGSTPPTVGRSNSPTTMLSSWVRSSDLYDQRRIRREGRRGGRRRWEGCVLNSRRRGGGWR